MNKEVIKVTYMYMDQFLGEVLVLDPTPLCHLHHILFEKKRKGKGDEMR
jgi:hypothetical protein